MASKQASIKFFFNEIHITLRNRKTLKEFLVRQAGNDRFRIEQLTYVFCRDEYLLSINRQHLQHDFYTDIITFDLSDSSNTINGEIYISTERVLENAKSFNEPFVRELHRVIFHGLLHLMGYKDKSNSDVALMRKMEDDWLHAYFAQRST